jgi:hypothetical protein
LVKICQQQETEWIAICDYLLLAIAKKMFRVDQDLSILSSAIGKVLFERKPLGELFVKPKRPMLCFDFFVVLPVKMELERFKITVQEKGLRYILYP